jgi:hypothetical protein
MPTMTLLTSSLVCCLRTDDSQLSTYRCFHRACRDEEPETPVLGTPCTIYNYCNASVVSGPKYLHKSIYSHQILTLEDLITFAIKVSKGKRLVQTASYKHCIYTSDNVSKRLVTLLNKFK